MALAETTRDLGNARRIAALVLSAGLLHLVLVQPNHPAAMTWRALLLFPLELPVILGLLILLRGWAAQVLRIALIGALMTIVVIKLADFGTFAAFSRGFNPVVDLHLVEAGWRLGSGSVGTPLAAAAVVASIAALLAVAAMLWWATGQWARLEPEPRWRAGVLAGTAVASVVAIAEIGQALGRWSLPAQPPGAAFTARVGYERAVTFRETLDDLRRFEAAARQDAFADRSPLLDRIGARDVLVIFVESYGRASHEEPLYAATHRASLQEAEDALSDAGLDMRSGWLKAPTLGGQSWLSHATFASGLWISDQSRHGAMLASGRSGLFHLASAAGFHTAAVMPAITLDWPEADFMGFETVLPAGDLGYRGAAFNWVTMPDQFTLLALDRLVRAPIDQPVFAQVALISSHAPWVPIPPLLDWDEIGDGSVYDEWANAGDPPDVVWRDRDRIREQYRLSIDYALQSVASYALHHAEEAPLMIVLGDHQAAPFVSQSDSLDVPVHVIGPPELVAAIDGWGWTPGLLPDPALPTWPMDAFRDRFLAAYSSGAPAL